MERLFMADLVLRAGRKKNKQNLTYKCALNNFFPVSGLAK